LRPYQQEALAAIEAAAAHGIRRALLVLATRLGKTIVFAGLIRRQAGRALVLVHRDELVAASTDTAAVDAAEGLTKGAAADLITARIAGRA
jgi:superfamily II DNA or RNA helicase